MYDFCRCNKLTGIHWLQKPVENLKIRVKLKPQVGTSLPKFDDYTRKSNPVLKLEPSTEEHILEWQEKKFSFWEVHHYGDNLNCVTETELAYHDMIKDLSHAPCKVFTYVHADYCIPLPLDAKKKKNNGVLNLSSCMQHLGLNETVGRIFGGDSVSMRHLFGSEENVDIEEEQWTAMHIVFDNSDHNEDPELVVRQETVLLSLYFNKAHGYILMSPDVNDLELNPYVVESESGVPWGYQYSVEVSFEEKGSGDELLLLLRKLYKKWEKKQRDLLNFVMPPLGKMHYDVNIEILYATDFEMDNLYIEYNLKLPEGIQCSGAVHGRTHTSEALRNEDIDRWYFGHVLELSLETDVGADPPPIKIFFEVISTDWWCRHRTEGYSYLPLSLRPGRYSEQLSCFRPEENDAVEAESRRFFVGGCHLIKDLEVLAGAQDANFTYRTTGTIDLRWNTISQSSTPVSTTLPAQPGTSSASALLLGAEAALRKYRKARARLAAATKDLDVNYEGSGDG